MAEEVLLMKGNEAIAHAAIRFGVDGYFGYPITPQSEVLETLAEQKPWETTGMVVVQAESEVAAINMVYGGAGTGKMVMTSSSSPGVSLKQEGISYLAGAELPCLIVNVMRGGPGLGTIQPSQADYFQTVKGGGHGDYKLIALAPASVQEMADFVGLAFDLAFKYRNPAIILADGVIGQMMEKVVLPEQRKRLTDEEVIARCPWAAHGKQEGRKINVITSLELDPSIMEKRNIHLQQKYAEIEANEGKINKFFEEKALVHIYRTYYTGMVHGFVSGVYRDGNTLYVKYGESHPHIGAGTTDDIGVFNVALEIDKDLLVGVEKLAIETTTYISSTYEY